ncbi:hypothetical protein IMG5_160230 [Ichthyophthirius multifiliis]|uniref:RSE1/DDB1/CPSF1 C-terminal domain-containing protein n=1 Tax=Ichthyophthirius multifiliis TaxID=5932 RepID=G0QZW2_ICHMU|nr:hypothetical protein IMG5_160230 [Ichthyophthirius multifiliis]EGR29224.1 hypothetical protein IMG5_160230 [Ichthyophthirius multifiliis]|eukprot:XP_004030460.1 hypothetical protein IMG5_160230 [Ichthyophthirius multifiliis]
MIGYLTYKEPEDDVNCKFYCHFLRENQMPELVNTNNVYKDFIFDFCFLNYPSLNDSTEHFKVVLMERDKVMMFPTIDGPYHQRLIISSIWNNKQYFLVGDIQKGMQLYEMDERENKVKQIGEENANINIRQCLLFFIQNTNTLRALVADEYKNLYAYSLIQQQDLNEKKNVQMELIANFHLGSKVNKIITDQKQIIEKGDNQQQEAVSHILLLSQDGNISVLKLIYEQGENTLLFDLQKTIYEELPYIGSLDYREYRECKTFKQSMFLRNSHEFFELNILDVYFNLTRPLQEKIAWKLNRSREDFINVIIGTILM